MPQIAQYPIYETNGKNLLRVMRIQITYKKFQWYIFLSFSFLINFFSLCISSPQQEVLIGQDHSKNFLAKKYIEQYLKRRMKSPIPSKNFVANKCTQENTKGGRNYLRTCWQINVHCNKQYKRMMKSPILSTVNAILFG